MITINVQIQVSPSSLPTFLPALRECVTNCVAEPECILFNVYQNQEDPGKFVLIEHWTRDREWLETVQLKKKYYEPYLAITKPLWVKERVIEYFDLIDMGHAVESA